MPFQSAALLDAPPCPDPYGIHAYAHPEDCGAFFLCTNGTLTFEYCENGLLFNGHGAVHNHCNYNWAVDCGNRKADCKYHAAFTIFESQYSISVGYEYEKDQSCERNIVRKVKVVRDK